MNDLEHFSLRWNNFHSNMSSGFCALLQEDALVDVTLAAEGRILQAHKLVLSVCSPYFKQIFAANPCKHPIVILKDVHHKQLSDLLNFMYQGEVNVRQEELATFLKTAELLQIKGLTEQEPQTSHTQSQGSFRDERQILAAQRTHHFPKIRQRRIRIPEKPIPVAPLAETRSSPAPSPPPTKRIKPAASPLALSDDNDKQDDAQDTAGNEEAAKQKNEESETGSVQVKTEPSSDIEGRSSRNTQPDNNGENAGGAEKDSSLQNAVSFQSRTPRGGSHETYDSVSNRTPQGLPSDLNASIASSSGLSITPSENSFGAPETQQGPLVPQYVHSRKGGLQLVLDGFLYTVHQQQGRNKYWRCVERGKLGCQGYCKTFMLEEGEVVQRLRYHNHGRQDDKIRERVNATRLRLQILHSLSQQQMGISNPFPAPNV